MHTRITIDELADLMGMGPNAPVIENDRGGKQSDIPYRFDLMPAKALMDIAKLLKHGADKYGDYLPDGKPTYTAIDTHDHLNHAMSHLFAYHRGDTSEGEPREHLVHTACRLLFALEVTE